jgi:hypothetical protein
MKKAKTNKIKTIILFMVLVVVEDRVAAADLGKDNKDKEEEDVLEETKLLINKKCL